MWHQIRFLFISAISPWVALICTPLALIVNYFSRAPYWRGDPLLTGEWALATFYLLTIPVCAITAYDVSRAVGPKSASILANRDFRRRWLPGLVVLNVALCIVLPVAVYVYTTVFFPAWDKNATAASVQVVSGCLGFTVLVMGSCLVGRRAAPFTALGITAICVLLVNISALGPGYRFIDYGGSTSTLVAYRYAASMVEYRFLLMLALAVIGGLLIRRRDSAMTSCLTYGFLSTIAILTIAALGNSGFRFDPNTDYAQVCIIPEDAPAMCTYPAHEYAMADLYRGIDVYAKKLEGAGVSFPGCIGEAPMSSADFGIGDDDTPCLVLPQSPDLLVNAPKDGLPTQALAGAYLNSLTCPQFEAAEIDEEFFARTSDAHDLLMRIFETDSPDEARRLGGEFNTLWAELKQCR